MRILVSNDDGILAPGIKALAKALSEIAEITVVAPDRDRSGSSNSLTLTSPIRTKSHVKNEISVEGTPTDCVHLAITGLMEHRPDMVVSGINSGANLSDDILYSGTVAAAVEGRFLGFPAMAVSLAGKEQLNYETAAEVAKTFVLHMIKDPLPPQTILNVNVPDVPLKDLKGFEVTRLGTRHIAEPTIKMIDPRGNEGYWVGLPGLEQDAGPGTDFHAINQGFVSVTQLQLDLTHYEVFDQLAGWTNGLLL